MLVLAILATSGSAQRASQDPRIGYVYPAGGQKGTTFHVIVGGQNLKDVSEAYISGGGVRIALGKYHKPLSQGEANRLRMKLDETRKRLREQGAMAGVRGPLTPSLVAKEAGVTEQQLADLEEFRKRQSDRKRQPNPQIDETVQLAIRLAHDARVGERELRLITPSGMSNPLYFHVGQWTECRETESNDRAPDPAVTAIPTVINGQIMPGDVDRFAFHARKGQRIVAVGSARELIPYLADAVPGWFQAVLTLGDAEENELAFAGAFGFRQDPVFSYEIPEDGRYILEIHDSIYRGREDFVYRITLGDFPFVTNVFPLGGRAGTRPVVKLDGWNLPSDELKVDAYYDRARPIRSILVRQQDWTSNRVPFAVDMIAECAEQEPNNERQSAQAVTMPIIVNGRIDRRDDRDFFRFDGSAGETVIAEVYARRLGSPTDSLLKLLDAGGKEIAGNDDWEDKASPLSTHHADSRILATLPANGPYYLRLTDAQRQGGPGFAYRLHLGPPRPDFQLRVVPSSVSLRPGGTAVITAYALRRDGFAEDIALELEGAPPGFRLDGAWIPGGQDRVRLTLTAPPKALEEPVALQLEGHATVRRRKISHLAIPAEDMMQAFAYHHLVPTKDWTVAVGGRGPGAAPVALPQGRFKLRSGGTARMRVAATGKAAIGDIRLELSDPPEGINIQTMAADGSQLDVILKADAKLKPGLKGNLIFIAHRERPGESKEGKPTPPRRNPIGPLPALPFEVVER